MGMALQFGMEIPLFLFFVPRLCVLFCIFINFGNGKLQYETDGGGVLLFLLCMKTTLCNLYM